MIKFSIVAVSFPFSDNLIDSKIRPVVCLTNPIGKYEEIVIGYITSKIPFEKLESDLIIDKNDEGFEQTGLLHTSTVRLHKLITISKKEVIGGLGVLSKKTEKEVSKKIKNLF